MSLLGARSLYAVLGVQADAAAGEIRRAYRRLVRRCHPDVDGRPDAVDRFREVADAYAVLSDPQRRRQYDGERRRMAAQPAVDRVGGMRRVRVRDGAAWRPRGEDPRSPFEARFRPTGIPADPDLRPAAGGARAAVPGFEVRLSVEEAVAGARRYVRLRTSLGPRAVEVRIPAGVVDGQRLRVRGRGGLGPAGAATAVCHLVVRIVRSTPRR